MGEWSKVRIKRSSTFTPGEAFQELQGTDRRIKRSTTFNSGQPTSCTDDVEQSDSPFAWSNWSLCI